MRYIRDGRGHTCTPPTCTLPSHPTLWHQHPTPRKSTPTLTSPLAMRRLVLLLLSIPTPTLLPASPTTSAPRGLIRNELAGAAAKNACVAATSDEHTSSRSRGETAVPCTLLVLVVMARVVIVLSSFLSCLMWSLPVLFLLAVRSSQTEMGTVWTTCVCLVCEHVGWVGLVV